MGTVSNQAVLARAIAARYPLRYAAEMARIPERHGFGLRSWLGSPRRGGQSDDSNPLADLPPQLGGYDVRVGAGGFAPIIGTFGALSIPAIFLLFGNSLASTLSAPLITMAIGSLIISILGTMFGAIGLAAIAAEREPTANLAAGAMSLSVATTIGFVGLFSGIEIIAKHFIPESDWLFLLLVAMAGIVGSLLTAAAITDSVGLGPAAESRFWKRPKWVVSYDSGRRQFTIAATIPAAIVVGAFALRRLTGLTIALSVNGVSWIIAGSAALVLMALVYAVIRTIHHDGGMQTGLRPVEAYVMTVLAGTYTAFMMFALP